MRITYCANTKHRLIKLQKEIVYSVHFVLSRTKGMPATAQEVAPHMRQ